MKMITSNLLVCGGVASMVVAGWWVSPSLGMAIGGLVAAMTGIGIARAQN